MQACKGLPGITPSVGLLPPANGNIWLAGNAGSSLMWDAYNHFMPPNSTACAAANDLNVNPGRAAVAASPRRLTEAGVRSWTPFLPVAIIPAASTSRSPTGRCSFIKNQITYQTWWSLGTRNGQEAISSDAY